MLAIKISCFVAILGVAMCAPILNQGHDPDERDQELMVKWYCRITDHSEQWIRNYVKAVFLAKRLYPNTEPTASTTDQAFVEECFFTQEQFPGWKSNIWHPCYAVFNNSPDIPPQLASIYKRLIGKLEQRMSVEKERADKCLLKCSLDAKAFWECAPSLNWGPYDQHKPTKQEQYITDYFYAGFYKLLNREH